jgi:predicted DNA-binding transcriptional regulator YafY
MRADRLLQIMLLLRARGKLTAQTLANELEVSRRTILRDIDALSSAGVPIYTEGGHGGGVALDEQYRISLNGLKEAEIRALFIAGDDRLLEEIGLGDAAASTRLKLGAGLPASHQAAVEHVRNRIYMDAVWWWHASDSPPFWDALQRAVDYDHDIRVKYRRFDGERVAYDLEPYSLVAKGGVWYLVARRRGDSEGKDEFRTYRVSRLQEVTLLDTYFQRQASFKLAEFWHRHVEAFRANTPVYACTLRVQSHRMSFVQWYTPGQHQIVEVHADESFTVRLQVESLEVARMMVLGLGADAAIVEPEELRDAVRQYVHDLQAHPF